MAIGTYTNPKICAGTAESFLFFQNKMSSTEKILEVWGSEGVVNKKNIYLSWITAVACFFGKDHYSQLEPKTACSPKTYLTYLMNS